MTRKERDEMVEFKGTDGVAAAGRPPSGEERPPLKTMTFKADLEIEEAVEMLGADLGPSVRARRSVAIRRAILAAAAALAARKKSAAADRVARSTE